MLRAHGGCGIDACSPAEVRLALSSTGFARPTLSFRATLTLTSGFGRAAHPSRESRFNCDAISTIRRLGARCPGRTIGIRLNPGLGAGYDERLRYASEEPTKFGVYPDRLAEAFAIARSAGLTVDTLHFHIGSGCQGNALEVLEQVLRHPLRGSSIRMRKCAA